MTTNWKEIKFLLVGGIVSFIIGTILRLFWDKIVAIVDLIRMFQ